MSLGAFISTSNCDTQISRWNDCSFEFDMLRLVVHMVHVCVSCLLITNLSMTQLVCQAP